MLTAKMKIKNQAGSEIPKILFMPLLIKLLKKCCVGSGAAAPPKS